MPAISSDSPRRASAPLDAGPHPHGRNTESSTERGNGSTDQYGQQPGRMAQTARLQSGPVDDGEQQQQPGDGTTERFHRALSDPEMFRETRRLIMP